MTRAARRHEAERVKAKRLKHTHTGPPTSETPAMCSCWMCGNPRKYFGKRTIQERRLFQEAA